MRHAPAHARQGPATRSGAAAFRCANCDRKNEGEFCAACGQKRIHPGDLSLGHAWHHIVHELLHLDGKVFGSLKLLLTRPGQLTLDFIEGRRARHVHPIRLFLVFSAVYFFFGDADRLRGLPTAVTRAMEQSAAASGSPANPSPAAAANGATSAPTGTKQIARLGVQMREGYEPFHKGVRIASFLSMGLWLAMFFRGRRLFLAEHLVMALHLSCVVMLWALVARAVNVDALGDWMLVPEFVVLVVYPALAARRVHGGGWLGIVVKVTAVSILTMVAYVLMILSVLGLIFTFTAPATPA